MASSNPSGNIIVWCKLTRRNQYNAYEPDVCQYIEQSRSLGLQKVDLGNISAHLNDYQIDISTNQQISRSGSRAPCKVERKALPSSHPLGCGYLWEFEGDTPGRFDAYDIDTMQLIDDRFKQLAVCGNVLDLSPQPYRIDFNSMTQIRINTQRVRKIRHRPLGMIYPQDNSTHSIPSHSSGAAQGVKTRRSHARPSPYGKSGHMGAMIPSLGLGNPVFLGAGASQVPVQMPSQYNAVSGAGMPVSGAGLPGNVVGLPGNIVGLPQVPFGGAFAGIIPGLISGNIGSIPASYSNTTPTSAQVQSSAVTESLPTKDTFEIKKNKSKSKPKSAEEIISSFVREVREEEVETVEIGEQPEAASCPICMEKLSEAVSWSEGETESCTVVALSRCGHQLHKICLKQMVNNDTSSNEAVSLKCLTCNQMYGKKTGICPPGTMKWWLDPNLHLAGYESYGAIVVRYMISPGKQTAEHPNPKKSYNCRGFPRTGYIPDCDKGRKVLKLLAVAFERKLMFTIGTSVTTGESDTVTWNEIHCKTEPVGNAHGHGYPDPNYLENTIRELASHGVTEDCLEESSGEPMDI